METIQILIMTKKSLMNLVKKVTIKLEIRNY